MMLLDWSGSMSDTLENTVDQLLNLVQFCKKVNIPFEVYFFTSERKHEGQEPSFTYKDGDWQFEDFNLVNCFSHRMTKKEFELACMYMYHMGKYFGYNYTYRRDWYQDQLASTFRFDSFGIPSEFYLGNTPLNEAIIFMNKMVPMFKKKYDIEKMTFITLTDGGANSPRGRLTDSNAQDGSVYHGYDSIKVYSDGKKKIVGGRDLTGKLLKLLKVNHGTNNIGFYIIKRVKKWDIERYIDAKDWAERDRKYTALRKEMTQNKAIAVNNMGYNKYFILDGKKMNVENFDMSDTEIKKETVGEFKRIFGKAMQSRLVSRVVLNKFIKEVA